MTSKLPSGTLTFFFTDIEGSTRLAARLGSGFKEILRAHDTIIRSVIAEGDGVEVKTLGDGFFVVFESARAAVESAVSAQFGLVEHSWPEEGSVRVRIGMHTGEAELGGDDYLGLPVTRASRIVDAGHGGQILVSQTTRDLGGAEYEYRDLGEHLLKGLEQPESIFQVLVPGQAANFPPLRTTTSRPNNLPVLSSSLIGREDDLATIKNMLSTHRLVTLLGPGGVGKTRLALDAGRSALAEFSDGVTLIDLSSISDPAFVLASVASEVGAEKGEVESVLGVIGSKDLLLILDNFEQVLDAAPDVAGLLAGGDGLKFLVTSQAPLRVSGEQRFSVVPLSGNGSVGLSVGGRLFVVRAREVNPAFTADDAEVEQLVELLDGLPLALELAAARANLLSAAEMVERLEEGGRLASRSTGLPDRHRSLDQALAWSYELLDPSDQATFRRLGVFAGGMTIRGAEEVSGGEPVGETLDSIGELVDRSLLLVDPDGSGRMRMLDGVRRFALERLDAADESARVATSFIDYFRVIGEEASDGLQSDRGEWWRSRLDSEHDNFREVLRRLVDRKAAEEGLALLGNIWRFYQSRGLLLELELWLDRFFALPGSDEMSDGMIKGLMARGALRYWQSRFDEALDSYAVAVEAARHQDDSKLIAEALFGVAATYIYSGRDDEITPMLEELKVIYGALGDDGGLADVMAAEAFKGMAEREGLSGMEPEFRRVEQLYRSAGRLIQATQVTYAIAGVATAEGRFESASETARRGIQEAVEMNDLYLQVWGIEWLAVAEAERGNIRLAGLLAGAAVAAQERLGGSWLPGLLHLEDARSRLEAILGEEAAEEAIAPGFELTVYEAVVLALDESSR